LPVIEVEEVRLVDRIQTIQFELVRTLGSHVKSHYQVEPPATAND